MLLCHLALHYAPKNTFSKYPSLMQLYENNIHRNVFFSMIISHGMILKDNIGVQMVSDGPSPPEVRSKRISFSNISRIFLSKNTGYVSKGTSF